MIYTSYFGKLKKMPENFHPIAICQYPPKWYQGPVYKDLAPTKGILFPYKENRERDKSYWDAWYNEQYTAQILDLLPDAKTLIQSIKDVFPLEEKIALSGDIWKNPKEHLVLLCFEKEQKDCHRQLVAAWLEEKGIPCREVMDADFCQNLEEGKIMEYIPKPNGYKTVNQWAKEGYRPKSSDVMHKYAATKWDGSLFLDEKGCPSVYNYVSPEDVVPINREEAKLYEISASIPKTKHIQEENKNMSPSPDAYAVCFDTETTGFSPFKGAELLQITIADHSGILFSSYLHPYHSKEWKKAMEAHHITPDMVKDAPYPHEVAGIIRELFAKAEVITGHNLKFDLAFVEKCLRIKIPEEKIFDTYPFFKQDRPGGHHKLGDAVEYYCPEKLDFYKNGAHNAEIDTLSNMAVYEAIVEREKEINLKKNLKKNLEEDMEIE